MKINNLQSVDMLFARNISMETNYDGNGSLTTGRLRPGKFRIVLSFMLVIVGVALQGRNIDLMSIFLLQR